MTSFLSFFFLFFFCLPICGKIFSEHFFHLRKMVLKTCVIDCTIYLGSQMPKATPKSNLPFRKVNCKLIEEEVMF